MIISSSSFFLFSFWNSYYLDVGSPGTLIFYHFSPTLFSVCLFALFGGIFSPLPSKISIELLFFFNFCYYIFNFQGWSFVLWIVFFNSILLFQRVSLKKIVLLKPFHYDIVSNDRKIENYKSKWFNNLCIVRQLDNFQKLK